MLAGSVTAGGYTPPGSRAGHCRGIDSGETFGPPPVAWLVSRWPRARLLTPTGGPRLT